MVGGFVQQQHIGLGDQGLGQRHALFGAARQGADGGLRIQVQALQGFAHALLPVPAIERFDLALHGVQVTMALGVFINEVAHARQPAAYRLKDAVAGLQIGLLGDVGDAGVALHLQHTIVWLFQPRQYLEQGGLAGAVAPDQTHAFLRFE